jgi:hypothetical protein
VSDRIALIAYAIDSEERFDGADITVMTMGDLT